MGARNGPLVTGRLAPRKNVADIFVDHAQQDSGFFVSVYRDTKKPLAADDGYPIKRSEI
jgi:hypothetical protein